MKPIKKKKKYACRNFALGRSRSTQSGTFHGNDIAKLNHSLEMEKASQWRPVLHLRRKHVAFMLFQVALVLLFYNLVLHGLFKAVSSCLGSGVIFNKDKGF